MLDAESEYIYTKTSKETLCCVLTIDFYVSEHRDKDTAKKFFLKALKSQYNRMPRVITTDKYNATEIAIIEMIYSSDLSSQTTHRKAKYLNNIIEQDHRFI